MMAAGVSCGNQWPDCQTNGAAWYQISGSQQDWEFHFHNVPMMVSQRHPAHCFSAVARPFSAVFPPFLCAVRLPGAETERTG